MTKPLVLKDLVTGERHSVSRKTRAIIGRGENTQIKTSSKDHYILESKLKIPIDVMKISRNHAELEYTYDGLAYLTNLSSSGLTYVGTLDNPFKIQVLNREQIFPGQVITLGTNYRFLYEKHEESVIEEQLEKKRRTSDTDVNIVI